METSPSPPEQPARREAEVQRTRATHLESELELAGRRLLEAEQARAESAGRIASLQSELAGLREQSRLLTMRLTAPLRGLERGLRWILAKLRRLAGMLARGLMFRTGDRRRG